MGVSPWFLAAPISFLFLSVPPLLALIFLIYIPRQQVFYSFPYLDFSLGAVTESAASRDVFRPSQQNGKWSFTLRIGNDKCLGENSFAFLYASQACEHRGVYPGLAEQRSESKYQGRYASRSLPMVNEVTPADSPSKQWLARMRYPTCLG